MVRILGFPCDGRLSSVPSQEPSFCFSWVSHGFQLWSFVSDPGCRVQALGVVGPPGSHNNSVRNTNSDRKLHDSKSNSTTMSGHVDIGFRMLGPNSRT